MGAIQPHPAQDAKRRRRPWFLLAVGLVCATVAILTHVFTRETPINRLKQQIRGELPRGSTREQVEAWAQRTVKGAPAVFPPPAENSARTWAEEAGVPTADLGSVLCVTIPSVGRYTTPLGEVAGNNLWVFFPLDEAGEVKGCYFLSLEDLAA